MKPEASVVPLKLVLCATAGVSHTWYDSLSMICNNCKQAYKSSSGSECPRTFPHSFFRTVRTGQESLLAAGLRDIQAGAAVKKAAEPVASGHALTACSGEVWRSAQRLHGPLRSQSRLRSQPRSLASSFLGVSTSSDFSVFLSFLRLLSTAAGPCPSPCFPRLVLGEVDARRGDVLEAGVSIRPAAPADPGAGFSGEWLSSEVTSSSIWQTSGVTSPTRARALS